MNTILIAITLLSLALTATMSIVAWRAVREERRRSDARVAMLAAGIHRTEPSFDRGMFGGEPPRQSSRVPAAVAGALTLAVVVTGAALFLGSDEQSVERPDHTEVTASETGVAAAETPLELVSLEHERSADELVVSGVVRNPAVGVVVARLTAVVLVFGSDGSFITSSRASVEPGGLAPGAQTKFVVTVPHAVAVGRYRVSFRTDDRVVPHVDRRS